MHYAVSGRAPSILSACLALLLAMGMHLSAATRLKSTPASGAQPAANTGASAGRALHQAPLVGTERTS